MGQAGERVERRLYSSDETHPFVISGVNAHFVNVAQKDPAFASFLATSDLNVADGMSLVMAAKLLQSNLPERVTGVDLMFELCGLAARTGRSVYLLGGNEGAAKGASAWLKKRFTGLSIVGVDRPPIGEEFDPEVVSQIRDRISKASPDFLFVCFGVPLQEQWITQFSSDLPVKVVMGNGAAFDVLAGFFTRPPKWVQKIGMEWFYRFCIEPKRLWRRYMLGNLKFVQTILMQAINQRLRPTMAPEATR